MVLKKVPKNVVILGLVSFFNDLASEMIYPIVPIFLTTVLHTSVPVVGLIEGIAEAVASSSKYIFGAFSDYYQKRKVFVVIGYSFGAVSKVLIGLATAWSLVLGARIIDRLGKGLRTAPRDSLLLDNATRTNKGFIFGFHRAFDSLGAVVGPLVALLLLAILKDNIRLTFFIASIPGIMAVALLYFFLKEKHPPAASERKRFVRIHWRMLDKQFQLFLLGSFLFALGNSSDAFLLLRAQNLGLSTTLIVLVYVLYNLSQTVCATPFGSLADRFGARNVYIAGLGIFALLYFCFGVVTNVTWLWLLFPLYGMYIAATDGVAKAFIAAYIPKQESGTYFGAYYFLIAVGTFLASVIGGVLWNTFTPSITFFYGSALSFLAFLLLLFVRQPASRTIA